jgi:hypothetical protein
MNAKIVKICLISAMLFSFALVLIHVGLLSYGIVTSDLVFFWFPLFLMGSIGFFSVFAFKSKFPLILILLFALSLHLISFVRQPPNMIWNNDGIYYQQLVNHIQDTGHWFFGFGTGETASFSFYPFFSIFESIFSLVTSISPMLCIKYSMAFLNILTLLGIYFLLDFTFNLNAQTKNLIVLLFSFNPLFHATDSYAANESFAIIFFPIILALMLGQAKSRKLPASRVQVVLLIFLVSVSLSHHFTSYIVAFSFLAPAVILYMLRKDFVRDLRVYLLSLILPFSWLIFVASPMLVRHLDALQYILSSLATPAKLVGYSYAPIDTSAAFYPSGASMQIALLRTVLMAAFALIGFIFSSFKSNKKAYNHFRVLLIAYGILTVGLLYFVNWRGITAQGVVLSDIRDRVVTFAYLPISFFAAFGIEALLRKAPKRPKSRFLRSAAKLVLGTVFVVILASGTIFTAFPRFIYDTAYSPITSSEFSVAPVEHYALGLWTLHFISNLPSENIVFTGSLSTLHYVIGYGLFNGTWDKTMFMNISAISMDTSRSIFYVANSYNIGLPDQLGQKLNLSTIHFLDQSFDRIYDNGVIYVDERARHQTIPNMSP